MHTQLTSLRPFPFRTCDPPRALRYSSFNESWEVILAPMGSIFLRFIPCTHIFLIVLCYLCTAMFLLVGQPQSPTFCSPSHTASVISLIYTSRSSSTLHPNNGGFSLVTLPPCVCLKGCCRLKTHHSSSQKMARQGKTISGQSSATTEIPSLCTTLTFRLDPLHIPVLHQTASTTLPPCLNLHYHTPSIPRPICMLLTYPQCLRHPTHRVQDSSHFTEAILLLLLSPRSRIHRECLGIQF